MTLYKCTDCNQEKPFEEMRKYRGKASVRCSICENIKRSEWRKKRKEETVEEVKEIVEIALPRTFKFEPYMSEKVWVRNNGNVHIKSRGFHC